jgi:flagellar motility protein MotE (MotC chaperone)
MSGELNNGIGVGKSGFQEKTSNGTQSGSLIERTKKQLFESTQKTEKKEPLSIQGIDVKKLVENFEILGKPSLNDQNVSKSKNLLNELAGKETESSESETEHGNISLAPKKLNRQPPSQQNETVHEKTEVTRSEIDEEHDTDTRNLSREIHEIEKLAASAAAARLNRLHAKDSAKILLRIEPAKVPEILSQMEPDKAREISAHIKEMDPNGIAFDL